MCQARQALETGYQEGELKADTELLIWKLTIALAEQNGCSCGLKVLTALNLDDSNTWEEGWSSDPEHGFICPDISETFASQHSKEQSYKNVCKPF